MYWDCFPFYAKSCVESEGVFFVFWEGKHKNKIVFEKGNRSFHQIFPK
jgi:hypothetical protein